MRQILLFAALAASLALLSGCALSKAKVDTAEDMTGKAAYQKISAEEMCIRDRYGVQTAFHHLLFPQSIVLG